MRSARNSSLFRHPLASTVRSAIFVSALVCTGCADLIITQSSNELTFRPGVLSTFAYGSAGGDMLTIVLGNPFQTSKETLDRAVTDAMQGSNNGPPTNFTTTPSDKMKEGFAVVVAFDVPDFVAKKMLCENRDAVPTQPEGNQLGLVMAFCLGKDLQSWSTAFGPRVTSPSDATFDNMITQATHLLIPNRDDEPNRDFVVMADPTNRGKGS